MSKVCSLNVSSVQNCAIYRTDYAQNQKPTYLLINNVNYSNFLEHFLSLYVILCLYSIQ